ncbi:MFS transporter [Rhodospirillum rubrum]|uniref:Major facilitator superfamily MFS_1 n=1 Tax=Rhodospirillum rubrum (strain ATCC 11170 / ATH 1.1.1 / DSM 467 / LMG 4362 / NCIMB 8255 / S1) TaxID=269796 RepID=Q2RWG5_RHORT|nr:MFS transporter [Rhodospirillum rubrum]ABC21530.1 Major facilitator superfamily MFS_1 [Rhodospirillum rubrum ATCC 11170]AEO47215.1 major facilitator transporter [Rhodospirillum rubrum F11]QXG81203.1 MFS transporter [Rhodospirillum rubrum]HAQ00374.1 MFS transporter [Rhodospirillum rubrum]HCF16801.1 MFS transporter [Rhodospirillum rubrum]
MTGPTGHAASGHLSAGRLLAYALPALALAIPTIPAFVLLPAFYAQDLGLGLAAVGTAMVVARLFDGLCDPLIGLMSDRHALPWPGGKRRRKPYVLAGALLAGLGLVQLFSPPAEPGIGYLLGWSMVLSLGWTLVSVPYTAWGAELSGDYHERARITGWREGLAMVGVLVAGAVPALALAAGLDRAGGLAWVAWAAILLGVPGLALLLLRVPEAPPPSSAPPALSWRDLRALAANGPFLRLVVAWFLNGMATGLPAALFPLIVDHLLRGSEAARNGLILVYFLSGVVFIPLWLGLARRIGKHRAWCVAMIVAIAAFVWVPLLGPGDVLAFGVICALTGMALGADLALPPAIQADVIDLDRLRTGQRREGLFFALWAMAQKLALALAVGIGFWGLALAGFETSATTQSPQALTALVVIYALIPIGLKVCAILVVWGHPLTLGRQKAIRRLLDRAAPAAPPGSEPRKPEIG